MVGRHGDTGERHQRRRQSRVRVLVSAARQRCRVRRVLERLAGRASAAGSPAVVPSRRPFPTAADVVASDSYRQAVRNIAARVRQSLQLPPAPNTLPDMATTTTVHTTDDISGEPDAETMCFGIDGVNYDIDLTEANAAELRGFLARYVAVGRRVQPMRSHVGAPRNVRRNSPNSPAGNGTAAADRGYDLAELREWAAANKIELPQRGRIPGSVVEMFKAR